MSKESIQQKLKIVRESIIELEPILQLSSQEIVVDPLRLRSAERLFQLLVDSFTDINTEIIAEKSEEIPDTYQGTFYTLEHIGIITSELANKIAPSVGLRNRLVHRYETVRPAFSIDEMKKYLPLYISYVAVIVQYIEKMK